MLIETRNLIKKYIVNEFEITALQGIDLQINSGDFVSIIGPSGCGKSSLLNILGLIDRCNSGTYIFNDIDTTTLNEKERAELRKKNMGFIFQSFNLIDDLTVFENIELPLIYQNISAKTRKEKVEQVLEKTKMITKKDFFPQQLSGGQQQRVAIARAIISEPKLILADEPTGNLDSYHGKEVMELLVRLNEGGASIILVTHADHIAEFGHRLFNLFDGIIISEKHK